jgi:hypothetical protein
LKGEIKVLTFVETFSQQRISADGATKSNYFKSAVQSSAEIHIHQSIVELATNYSASALPQINIH